MVLAKYKHLQRIVLAHSDLSKCKYCNASLLYTVAVQMQTVDQYAAAVWLR